MSGVNFQSPGGYVMIKIEGLSLEMLLNTAVSGGVKLYKVRRAGRLSITAAVKAHELRVLRTLLADLPCDVEVVSRRGVAALLWRMRMRYALVWGVVLFIAVLIVLSRFVWQVDVEGLYYMQESELRQQLQEMDIYPGAWVKDLDHQKIENTLMLNNDSFAWVGVHTQGTHVVVEVIEVEAPPKNLREGGPSDMIALRDGVIERVSALEGTAMVREGDTVRKGDVLISGMQKMGESTVRDVRSRGEVMARVWYTASASVKMQAVLEEPTGNTAKKQTLVMGNWRIPVSGGDSPFDVCTVQRDTYAIISEHLFLPVSLEVETYSEVLLKAENIPLADLKRESEKVARSQLTNMLPRDVQILSENVQSFVLEDDTLQTSVSVECLQDIAMEHAREPAQVPQTQVPEENQGQ